MIVSSFISVLSKSWVKFDRKCIVQFYQSNELYESNSNIDFHRIRAVANGIRQKVVLLRKQILE